MKDLERKFKIFFHNIIYYLKKIKYREKRSHTGKRKIDQFRREIIKLSKKEDIIHYTIAFLKEYLSTEEVGFFFWSEEYGHFVDYADKDNKAKHIRIYDPFLLAISEYDTTLTKMNLQAAIKQNEHENLIMDFFRITNGNILIPLNINATTLGFIYARTGKFISKAEYFSLEEIRYFTLVTLSNSLIYERLQYLLANLEKEIENRTHELQKASNTILQQEKMATLGTMVAGIAHELNTPVSVIKASITNIYSYFESFLEFLSTTKENHKLPDTLSGILYYLSFHISAYSTLVQTRAYKIKKTLRDHLLEKYSLQDEEIVEFLIDFNLFTGSTEIFENPDNLTSRIVNFLSSQNEVERKTYLKIMKYVGGIYENANRILTSTGSIQHLIQSLKTYARASKNEFKKIHPAIIIENSLKMLEPTIKQKVKIEKHYHYNGEIMCDPNQIQQVLINILINAFQALMDSRKEDPVIKIYLHEYNTDKIEIQIHDNGPGIPEEIQDHVWDLFFTTKPQGQGTGLGLGIVKKIIDNHRGQVFFSSDKNGTVFYIRLPKEQETSGITASHPSLKFGRYDWRE